MVPTTPRPAREGHPDSSVCRRGNSGVPRTVSSRYYAAPVKSCHPAQTTGPLGPVVRGQGCRTLIHKWLPSPRHPPALARGRIELGFDTLASGPVKGGSRGLTVLCSRVRGPSAECIGLSGEPLSCPMSAHPVHQPVPHCGQLTGNPVNRPIRFLATNRCVACSGRPILAARSQGPPRGLFSLRPHAPDKYESAPIRT